MIRQVVVLVAAAFAFAALRASYGEEAIEYSGRAFGTFYHVTLVEPRRSIDITGTTLCSERALERIDALMSTWRADSEVSEFNRARHLSWHAVSKPLFHVVAHALEVAAISGGAFDPSVRPLLTLWGFGANAGRLSRPPSAAQIAHVRRHIGPDYLVLRAQPRALRKRRADVQLELSGLAKGFAVDVLARQLQAAGHSRFLVNIGGEMRARGQRAGGGPWRIGVELPTEESAGVARVLGLTRGALATSGSYRRRRSIRGQSVPDTIDPRSGIPVKHALRSATVVAVSAMRADALATTLMVLGPTMGFEFAREHQIAAVLIGTAADPLRVRTTPALDALQAAGALLPESADPAADELLKGLGCAN